MEPAAYLPILKIQFCPPLAGADFYELLLQFLLNLSVLFIISRGLYYRWNRNPEYLFTQLISGIVVFMICAMLRWVQLELGLVLGLFAIFAIIRFRTVNVPVKEMAYLFMTVGVSAVNALLQLNQCLPWIILINLLLIGLTFLLERMFFNDKVSRRNITYNKTDLLRPSRYDALLEDLKALTELNIVRFEIGKVDYVKNIAQLRIYFRGGAGENIEESESRSDDE